MGCGCKKNKVQEIKPAQVVVNETKPSDNVTPNLNSVQKQQVDLIIERITELNSKKQ